MRHYPVSFGCSPSGLSVRGRVKERTVIIVETKGYQQKMSAAGHVVLLQWCGVSISIDVGCETCVQFIVFESCCVVSKQCIHHNFI